MNGKRDEIRIVTASTRHASLAATLFDAYRQFYRQPSNITASRIFLNRRLKRKESVLFLAFLKSGSRETPVGLVHLYPTFSSVSLRRQWILNDLFVIPQARRRGVGEALMNRARRLAEDTKANALVLDTAIDNFPAQRLYERLGFKRDTAFYRYALHV